MKRAASLDAGPRVGILVAAEHSVVVEADFAVPETVLAEYGLADAHIELLTGGRTNRTLRVRAGRDLVLQQMRAGAHADLLGIMENLVRVTSHLDWRRVTEGEDDSWYPLLMPTNVGKPFIMTENGDIWRAFQYRTGQILRSAQPQATLASAGAIYGRFTRATLDLGGPPLLETAPGFHDLDGVYANFLADVVDASTPLRSLIDPHLKRLASLVAEVGTVSVHGALTDARQRVVHNDSKLSNVLFDRDHGRAIAVLDLDLVMMGPAWHDVGDLVRSSCWHAPHAELPHFNIELYDAVVGAYVESAGDSLRDDEIYTFAAAGPRISLELGIRYLNDLLRDVPRLEVTDPGGHLKRGLANMRLAEEMLEAYDGLCHAVEAFLDERRV